jgi:hypothetical protein
MAAQKGKRGKYAREVEKIKRMSAINNMLSKGDIENALLSSGSKESEHSNETVVDAILNKLQQNERGGRDMEMVDKLTEISTNPGAPMKSATREMKKAKHKHASGIKRLERILKLRRHAKKAHRRH